ncbi:MAG: sulfatase-like hydrolase/transferase [Candidatus Hydrogenedentes bacterium]|nr:sulfatase-like hydrolase/transferase [Candidatus Hydrogenedentota bacterium]
MAKRSRRDFIKHIGAAAGALTAIPGCAHSTAHTAVSTRRPNVVLVLTDDQGYGDMACHGNPYLKTPNIDRLYGESARFTQFHVSPVCTPTRACLMTGRYNYRTGAIDTYRGRAMMHPDEVTIAEMLKGGGYATGIFGKWHLGDNYPLRAMDQGFDESLVHRGGGLLQPSSPPGDSYFAPIVWRNGKQEQLQAYCTDAFTNAAMDFIERHKTTPFFVYLATNAPHAPLFVDDRYVAPYLTMGLDERTAKAYGMVTNFDENLGRLLTKLDQLGIADDTIVIYMTDNGPDSMRYNAGMRGKKGDAYEGGIRVPFFVRWPGKIQAGRDIDRIAAHIDLTPALLDLCGVPGPQAVHLDGKSIAPLLRGAAHNWPDRALFSQWHRGDAPEPHRNAAVRTQQYKLVNGKELYDLSTDPAENLDIAANQPEIVNRLRAAYDDWFKDVSSTRGYEPPKILLGAPQENPSVLTRQDWRGAEGWSDSKLDQGVGYWEVQFATAGLYDFLVDIPPQDEPATVWVDFNGARFSQPVEAKAESCRITGQRMDTDTGRVQAWVEHGNFRQGARFLTVERKS